jgi:hypothetical protein
MNENRTNGSDLFTEEIPAYALGALDAEEAARLEAHLAGCATCQAELAEFQTVASALAFSVAPAPEPAGHLERFQHKLAVAEPLAEPPGHQERFLNKLNAQAAPVEDAPAPDRAARPRLPAPPQRTPVAARPWWQALNPLAGWALAGALALLLILAGLWGFDGQRRATEAAQQAQATATQAAATSAQRDALARLLANPAAQSVVLTGQVAGQTVQARLVADPATGQAVLVADHLPPVTAGQVYELWLIKGQTPVPVDVVAPDARGGGLLVFQIPGAWSTYNVAALTVEPGFVPQPTTTPIAVGNI